MMSGVYFFIGILSFILVSAILSLTLVLLGKGISYSRAESEKPFLTSAANSPWFLPRR